MVDPNSHDFYLAGSFEGAVGFGGDPLEADPNHPAMFVAAFNGTDHTHRWSKSWSAPNIGVQAVDLALSGSRLVVVANMSSSTADASLQISEGVYVNSVNGSTALVMSLDVYFGTPIVADVLSTTDGQDVPNTSSAEAVALSSPDGQQVAVTGRYQGELSFNGDPSNLGKATEVQSFIAIFSDDKENSGHFKAYTMDGTAFPLAAATTDVRFWCQENEPKSRVALVAGHAASKFTVKEAAVKKGGFVVHLPAQALGDDCVGAGGGTALSSELTDGSQLTDMSAQAVGLLDPAGGEPFFVVAGRQQESLAIYWGGGPNSALAKGKVDEDLSLAAAFSDIAYVGGTFAGKLDIGSEQAMASGSTDVFVVRINATGVDAIASFAVGGDRASVQLAAANNLYLAGVYTQSIAFGDQGTLTGNAEAIYVGILPPDYTGFK